MSGPNDVLLDALALREHARYHILSQLEATERGWITEWIHEELGALLDGFITAVERQLSPRLIICLPPRAGKTITVGEHFPVQCLGRNPHWEVIYATHNDERAMEVGRDCRKVFDNPVIQDIHPKLRIDPNRHSAANILTTEGGQYSSVARGGSINGKGAHVLIIDDILKGRAEAESLVEKEKMWRWYTADARSRLMPGAGIIIMNTRWALDDLTGRVLDIAKADPKADQWCTYSFPAIATADEKWRKKGEPLLPKRWPMHMLEATKATISAQDWEALYQQSPFVAEGNHFKADWFQFYDVSKPLSKAMTWGVGIDFASTEDGGDYSVTWPFALDANDNVYFSPDVFHEQCETNVHAEKTFDILEKFDSKLMFVEKGVLLNVHKPEFRRQIERRRFYPKVIEFNRSRSKLEYAQALMTHMQNRKVYWPDTPFMRQVAVPQFLRFTGVKGGRDDLVDAAVLPFLSFKEIQRPYEIEPELEVAPEDSITRFISDRLDSTGKRKMAPFSAGQRDYSDEEDDE